MSDGEATTVLFVCRHGAAKSVLAAADLRHLAAAAGLPVVATAAGVEPSGAVAPAVVQVLGREGDPGRALPPRRVTASDLAAATRVITFNLDPGELPEISRALERWDDVPAVSEDFLGARAAIGRHLEDLVERLGQHSRPNRRHGLLERPDPGDPEEGVRHTPEEEARGTQE